MPARTLRGATLVALATVLVTVTVSQAASITWTGNQDTDFSQANNWLGGVAPANSINTDVGVFSGAVTTNQPLLTAGRSINGLNLTSAGWTLFGTGTANALTVGTGGIDSAGAGINVIGASGNITGTTGQTWTIGQGNTLRVLSIISGASTANTITKNGAGTLELANANTTSRRIAVSGGTLRLVDAGSLLSSDRYSVTAATLLVDNTGTAGSSDRIRDAATMTLASGTLDFRGRASTASTETVGATTLNSGTSTINMVAGAGGSAVLTLSSLTRNAGGVLEYNGSGLGSAGNNPRVLITGQADSSFLGAWALANYGLDYTKYDATGGLGVTALSGADYESGDVGDWSASDNVLVDAARTLSAAASINSLNIKSATGRVVALGANGLSIASGGILASGANHSITGTGTLTTSGTEWVVGVDDGDVLDIGAVLGTAGASLTKTGAGTLVLSSAAANTYGGAGTRIYINEGTLRISSLGHMGTANTTAVITFDGGTMEIVGNVSELSASNKRSLSFGPRGGTIYVADGFTWVNQGAVSGTGDMIKTGGGTLTLTHHSAYSSGTGDTWLNEGTLRLYTGGIPTGTLRLGTATLEPSGSGLSNYKIGTSGAFARLSLDGNTTFGALATYTGEMQFDQPTTLTGNRTLTILNPVSLLGIINDGGAGYKLTKAGANTLTLGGDNLFSGGVTINAGTVKMTHANALGSGTATLNGGTLDLNGLILANDLVGNGTVTSTGGVIALTGLVSPGASAGTQTYNAETVFAGIYEWELLSLKHTSGGGGYAAGTPGQGGDWDVIIVDGQTFTIDGAADMALGVQSLLPDADPFWIYNHSWTIISAVNGGTIVGNFNLGDGPGFFTTNEGTTLTLHWTTAAVPEPATLGLLALGGAALTGASIRRRR